MSNQDHEPKKTKRPYEPPRIFDLSGSVAYAKEKGRPGDRVEEGGSPSSGGKKCQPGGVASGGKCQPGNLAGGGNCNPGSSASAKCQPGGNPIGSGRNAKVDYEPRSEKETGVYTDEHETYSDVEPGGVAEDRDFEREKEPSVEGTTDTEDKTAPRDKDIKDSDAGVEPAPMDEVYKRSDGRDLEEGERKRGSGRENRRPRDDDRRTNVEPTTADDERKPRDGRDREARDRDRGDDDRRSRVTGGRGTTRGESNPQPDDDGTTSPTVEPTVTKASKRDKDKDKANQ